MYRRPVYILYILCIYGIYTIYSIYTIYGIHDGILYGIYFLLYTVWYWYQDGLVYHIVYDGWYMVYGMMQFLPLSAAGQIDTVLYGWGRRRRH